MPKEKRSILSVDFDGVIHSYISGWKGPRNIHDAPVDGALAFLALAAQNFEVNIFSSRSRYFRGRAAMKRWLFKEYMKEAVIYEKAPFYIRSLVVSFVAFDEPWYSSAEYDLKQFVYKDIKWPKTKPPAHVHLDGRCIQFEGTFPSVYDLIKFKPWYKGDV